MIAITLSFSLSKKSISGNNLKSVIIYKKQSIFAHLSTLLLGTHYCNPSQHCSLVCSDPFKKNYCDLGRASLPVNYEMMTPKGESLLPFSKTTLLECFNVCEVFSAPLSNPALILTSWLALLHSCRGGKFNDFLRVIELISTDSGFEP